MKKLFHSYKFTSKRRHCPIFSFDTRSDKHILFLAFPRNDVSSNENTIPYSAISNIRNKCLLSFHLQYPALLKFEIIQLTSYLLYQRTYNNYNYMFTENSIPLIQHITWGSKAFTTAGSNLLLLYKSTIFNVDIWHFFIWLW